MQLLMLRNVWFMDSSNIRLFDWRKHSRLVRMSNGDIMASRDRERKISADSHGRRRERNRGI